MVSSPSVTALYCGAHQQAKRCLTMASLPLVLAQVWRAHSYVCGMKLDHGALTVGSGTVPPTGVLGKDRCRRYRKPLRSPRSRNSDKRVAAPAVWQLQVPFVATDQ